MIIAVLDNYRIIKGDEVSTDYRKHQDEKRMDIKQLIEASSNNMLSELSRDCQISENIEKEKCSHEDLFEIEMKEEKRNKSK